MKIIYIITLIIFLLTGCKQELNNDTPNQQSKSNESTVQGLEIPDEELINPEGMTIEERYLVPKEYERIEVLENSFGEFLRNRKLKLYGEKVLYYDGREKNKKGVYDSVFDVDIGDRDLHQCADAIMSCPANTTSRKSER